MRTSHPRSFRSRPLGLAAAGALAALVMLLALAPGAGAVATGTLSITLPGQVEAGSVFTADVSGTVNGREFLDVISHNSTAPCAATLDEDKAAPTPTGSVISSMHVGPGPFDIKGPRRAPSSGFIRWCGYITTGFEGPPVATATAGYTVTAAKGKKGKNCKKKHSRRARKKCRKA